MRVDAFKAPVGAFKGILFSRDCVKDAAAADAALLLPPCRHRPLQGNLMHQSR